MIKDFIEFRDKSININNKLMEYQNVYTKKLGLTEEFLDKLQNEFLEESKKKIITDDYKTMND